jgi:hypothetical protein
MRNRQRTHSDCPAPLPNEERLGELAKAVCGPAPEGNARIGRTAAPWKSRTLRQPTITELGWVYLVHRDGKRRNLRLRHVLANAA